MAGLLLACPWTWIRKLPISCAPLPRRSPLYIPPFPLGYNLRSYTSPLSLPLHSLTRLPPLRSYIMAPRPSQALEGISQQPAWHCIAPLPWIRHLPGLLPGGIGLLQHGNRHPCLTLNLLVGIRCAALRTPLPFAPLSYRIILAPRTLGSRNACLVRKPCPIHPIIPLIPFPSLGLVGW